jgi:hypothetical protein
LCLRTTATHNRQDTTTLFSLVYCFHFHTHEHFICPLRLSLYSFNGLSHFLLLFCCVFCLCLPLCTEESQEWEVLTEMAEMAANKLFDMKKKMGWFRGESDIEIFLFLPLCKLISTCFRKIYFLLNFTINFKGQC